MHIRTAFHMKSCVGCVVRCVELVCAGTSIGEIATLLGNVTRPFEIKLTREDEHEHWHGKDGVGDILYVSSTNSNS